jgi:hypothetical protein
MGERRELVFSSELSILRRRMITSGRLSAWALALVTLSSSLAASSSAHAQEAAAPQTAEPEGWPASVRGLKVVVPDPLGTAAWGGPRLAKALRALVEAPLGGLVPSKSYAAAQKKLKLSGKDALTPEAVARAGKEAGAHYVLTLEVTKKGWLYTAQAILINTENALVQMDFRAQYYKPETEAADRGQRIGKRAVEKMAELIRDGVAPRFGEGATGAVAGASSAPVAPRAPGGATAQVEAPKAPGGATAQVEAPKAPGGAPPPAGKVTAEPSTGAARTGGQAQAGASPAAETRPAPAREGAVARADDPLRDPVERADDGARTERRASDDRVDAGRASGGETVAVAPRQDVEARAPEPAPAEARRTAEPAADGVVVLDLGPDAEAGAESGERLRLMVAGGAGVMRSYDLSSAAVPNSGLSYALDPLSLVSAKVEVITPGIPLAIMVRGAFRPVRYTVTVRDDASSTPGGSLLDVFGLLGYQLALGGEGRGASLLIPYAGVRLGVASVDQHPGNIVLGSSTMAALGGLAVRLPVNELLELNLGVDGGLVLGYTEDGATSGANGSGVTFGGDLDVRLWVADWIAVAFDNRFTAESVTFDGQPTRQAPLGEQGQLADVTVSTKDLRSSIGVALRF